MSRKLLIHILSSRHRHKENLVSQGYMKRCCSFYFFFCFAYIALHYPILLISFVYLKNKMDFIVINPTTQMVKIGGVYRNTTFGISRN